MFKIVGLLMLVFYNVFYTNAAGTERLSVEKKGFVKLFRDTCMPESGVEESVLEKCYDGVFENVKSFKVYMKCIYKTADALDDDGHFDEQILIELASPVYRDWALKYTTDCELGAWNTEDELLDALFNYSICVYNSSPTDFCCF